MQHYKLDTLRKELTGSLKKSKSSGKFKALSHLSKFDDQCDRPTSKRHLSAESGNTGKLIRKKYFYYSTSFSPTQVCF